ncbi:DNA adenine methylase [Brevibacterium sanguinis]|uniref:Site-specific DNA-methyltransferase (adenine-specific) n=2 Tax=Brevibacterium TaxID=1696 RepID=A0A366IR17_9MICO|nr:MULTISPECIES: DNA adenine methylase [Brevibacterium]RBP67792.1 DNA adenine methylase [Brevibacterium sanguinis]RBP74791.1 DNA adenine methylase [Brevibacterium celere]
MTETCTSDVAIAGRAAPDTNHRSPFLRWAGGKRWLVPQIQTLLGDETIARYHEPFLGGGSVFFGIAPPVMSFLSDLNEELINVYKEVRDQPETLAELIRTYPNTSEAYYEVRASEPVTAIEQAARFIYLNHTSFNGIFRVNLKGKYNVPYGHRKYVKLPTRADLQAASRRLQSAELTSCSFEQTISQVQSGDVVFLDPPYTVAHNQNGFIKYNQHLFSFDDQRKLASVIESIATAGAKFILTNAAHSSVYELFAPLGRTLTITRPSLIGGKNASRGRIEELLFTNIGVK